MKKDRKAPPPRHSSSYARISAAPHMVWTVIFIIAPLLFVGYYAFTTAEGAFTLENITALSEHTETFWLSVCMSIIATVLCLLIGYPLAYIISQLPPKKQKLLIVFLMLRFSVSRKAIPPPSVALLPLTSVFSRKLAATFLACCPM